MPLNDMTHLTRSKSAIAAAIALAMLSRLSAAAPPTSETMPVDATFKSQFWSAVCGVPVYIHAQGTSKFRLFYDSTGSTVVKELDQLAGYRETVFSPTDAGGTGKSFSYARSEPVRITYPDGAALGARAVIYDTGLGGFYAPGVPAAGRTVLEGVVAFIAPGNVPIVDVVGLVAASGRQISFDDAVAARCGFLANP